MNIQWVNSSGGPLICSSIFSKTIWQGIDGSSIASLQNDYERACEVHDYLGVIECGSERVLVLADEPLSSTVISRKHELLIARWVACGSKRIAEECLSSIPEILPTLGAHYEFSLAGDELVIFDSALKSPRNLNEEFVFQAQAGNYLVGTERYVRDGVFDFLIHRFKSI